MILSNYLILKELGYGMFGTVYKIKTPNKKTFALKIQHIEKKDIKSNNKSSIWREINFSINFANKYPNQFIKLYEYEFIDKCKLKQKYPFDLTTLSSSLQKNIKKLSTSPYCVKMVYELVNGDLSELEGKLTIKQIYSMIIQLTFTIKLLHSNNYTHGDIHYKNIGWNKTLKLTKIKLGRIIIPTYGYIFKLIDYGMILKKTNIYFKKDKKNFNINFNDELLLLMHLFVDTKIYDYIKINKININFNDNYNKFKKTRFFYLIKKYSLNKNIQMFLFDILFPEQYQKIAFGQYYNYTIQRKLFIPFEDIEYFLLNYKNSDIIIKYFINKLIK